MTIGLAGQGHCSACLFKFAAAVSVQVSGLLEEDKVLLIDLYNLLLEASELALNQPTFQIQNIIELRI